VRLGLVACEILSLTALLIILLPLADQVRLPSVARFLAGWPDLSDAHAACQQFVRQGGHAAAAPEVGTWTWLRLNDGRFRIIGTMEQPTAKSGVGLTRYQCDVAPLNSDGRWRVDGLVMSRERVTTTAMAPSGGVKGDSRDR
jgi:hypothetical protein